MPYTEQFSEGWELLGSINPASYSSEQNSGRVNLGSYVRAVIIIHGGVLGQNVDVDIEQGQTATSTLKAFDTNDLDITLTATTDNNTVSVIEVRPERFEDGYQYLNLEMTPAGASSIFGAQIWGEPRFKPATNALLDTVTD